jgi:hypothetical protein
MRHTHGPMQRRLRTFGHLSATNWSRDAFGHQPPIPLRPIASRHSKAPLPPAGFYFPRTALLSRPSTSSSLDHVRGTRAAQAPCRAPNLPRQRKLTRVTSKPHPHKNHRPHQERPPATTHSPSVPQPADTTRRLRVTPSPPPRTSQPGGAANFCSKPSTHS